MLLQPGNHVKTKRTENEYYEHEMVLKRFYTITIPVNAQTIEVMVFLVCCNYNGHSAAGLAKGTGCE